jgi:hypothetical protein
MYCTVRYCTVRYYFCTNFSNSTIIQSILMLELYFLYLEAMLKLKAKLEPLPPGPEELQQVLPQPQHVDAHNLVVVLRLKLHGNLGQR